MFRLGRAAGVNLALAGLFIIAWLLYPKAYAFSDQAYYLIRAYGLGNMLDWPMSFYFEHRFGLLLPHWASYQLFGVSHETSFLPQLGLLLLLLFAVLRYCEGMLQKTVAALVLLPLLPYAADARPDLGVACFMFLALSCIGERNGQRGVLFGCCLVWRRFMRSLLRPLLTFWCCLLWLCWWRMCCGGKWAIVPPPVQLRAVPLLNRLPLKGGVILVNSDCFISVR